MTTPRIYVACLASYNAGTLHGLWIDFFPGIEAGEVQFAINAMLKTSKVWDAEEWDIHDAESFAGFKSNDLDQLCQVADLIHQHGEGAVQGYFVHQGQDADLDEFSNFYLGCFKSEVDFCQEHLGEAGGLCTAAEEIQVFDWATLDQYIDWERIANDAFINLYFSHEVSYEEVHVYVQQ